VGAAVVAVGCFFVSVRGRWRLRGRVSQTGEGIGLGDVMGEVMGDVIGEVMGRSDWRSRWEMPSPMASKEQHNQSLLRFGEMPSPWEKVWEMSSPRSPLALSEVMGGMM
jgi:hypothetical protein